jgi:hypothetical protein
LGGSTTDQTKNNICEQRNKCDGLFIHSREKWFFRIFAGLPLLNKKTTAFDDMYG